MNQLTFWSEEPPASLSALQDSGRDLMTPAENSCLPTLQSLHVTGLDGLSGKTSPVSCHPTEDGILVPSSGRWGNWGMGGPTGSWTLSGSEWPRDAAVCSLSDVLETGKVPQRYFLSPKACAGILRRAEKRQKTLPEPLRQALLLVVQAEDRKELPETTLCQQSQAVLTPNVGGGKLTHQSATNGHIVPSFWNGEQITQTLDAVLHKGQTMPEKNRFPAVLVPDVARTLNARHDSIPCVDRGMDVVAAFDHQSGGDWRGLDLKHLPNLQSNQIPAALSAMKVRRLTVTECERLQGFPDNYTNIPGAKDGPRYKALGNSMAVPCMRWIGERIARAEGQE